MKLIILFLQFYFFNKLDQAVHRSSASEIIGSTDGLKEIASGSSSARSSKKWKLSKSLADIVSDAVGFWSEKVRQLKLYVQLGDKSRKAKASRQSSGRPLSGVLKQERKTRHPK
jgi:hypothetical protein